MKPAPKPSPRRPRAAARKKTAPAPVADSMELKSGRATTINDIARLAGVSKKTVSRVLNQSPLIRDGTRARVQAVIDREKLPARPAGARPGLPPLVPHRVVYDNPNAQYIVNIQDGALDALRGTDFELVVHPCDRAIRSWPRVSASSPSG